MKRNIKICLSILFLLLLFSLSLFSCTKKTEPQQKEKKPNQNIEQKKPNDEQNKPDENNTPETPEDTEITDENMETLFEMRFIGDEYSIVRYIGNLTKIKIPEIYKGNKVVKIGNEAFKGNTIIKNIEITKNIKEIGEKAFESCQNLKTVTLNEGLEKIDYSAFSKTNIESINIPNSVKEISYYAFESCQNLKTVTLNEGLEKIDYSAFSATNVELINIPNSIKEIGTGAFGDAKITIDNTNDKYEVKDNCLIEKNTNKLISAGKHSIIPNYVTYIAEYAFFKSKIESINIPGNVKEIGERAFENCQNLKTVTLNEGLERISGGAFSNCSLESINIPSTLNEIIVPLFGDAKITVHKDNAKYEVKNNCLIEKDTNKLISGRKDSIIPDNVTSIETGAFFNSKIESINIPGNVKEIGERAFENCQNLKTVTLNEGLEKIESYAFSETNIESINIPSSVKEIDEYVFENCQNLKTVTLNEGLEKIKDGAFSNSSIESIIIPNSVQEIDNVIFSDCKSLSKIYCRADSKPSKWKKRWNENCNAEIVWNYKD